MLNGKVQQNNYFRYYHKKDKDITREYKMQAVNFGQRIKHLIVSDAQENALAIESKLNDIATRIQKRINRGNLSQSNIAQYKAELKTLLAKNYSSYEENINNFIKCCILLAKHTTSAATKYNYFWLTNKTTALKQLSETRNIYSKVIAITPEQLNDLLRDVINVAYEQEWIKIAKLNPPEVHQANTNDLVSPKTSSKAIVNNYFNFSDCFHIEQSLKHWSSIDYTQITEAEKAKIGRQPSLEKDAYLFLHGSGDKENKAEINQLTLSKLNKDLRDQGYTSAIIDGPSSIIGTNFTRNIFAGLEKLLIMLVQGGDFTTKQFQKEIILTGFSRGACEAIAINNLFCSLLNNAFSLKTVPYQLRNYITPECRKLVNQLKDSCLTKDNFKIRLILVDPVSGPRIGPLNRGGFLLIDNLEVLPHHETYIMSCWHENRAVFDIHIPTLPTDYPITRIKIPTRHGRIATYPKPNGRKNYASSEGHNCLAYLLGLPEEYMLKKMPDKELRIGPYYRVTSQRARLSLFHSQRKV